MEILKVKPSKIKENPDNPRVIQDEKFEQLCKSIKEFPQMLELRPIVVNKDYVVLGGNMRFSACKKLGLKEIPIVFADSLTPEQEREFVIKDNVSFGDWDWEAFAGGEWNTDNLRGYGLHVWIADDEPQTARPTTEQPQWSKPEEGSQNATTEGTGIVKRELEVICPNCGKEFNITY